MHPELQHAIKSGSLTTEVIRIFKKHHSGTIEKYIDGDIFKYKQMVHGDGSFWDKWKPLSLRLDGIVLWNKPTQPPEPFLNIYKVPTQEIISWLCDSKRKTNICVVVEPQRNLLPADFPFRAKVIASICCDADRLGGRLFYPKIHGIASQLAARYPPYRRILAKRLVDNPRILELPTRALFKKLIYEPWKVVQQSHPRYIAAPPVIVLEWPWYNGPPDGELFDVIREFSLSQRSSSLLWILVIGTLFRPLTGNFLEPIGQFVYIKHPVNYDAGPSDPALILRYMFRDVHPRLSDDRRLEAEDLHRTREKWPSDEQISQLARIFSGTLESIETVIKFVNRQDGGTPEAHLERFLSYMIDTPSPSNERPHCALDHFYIRAFSNIPPQFLTVANEALGIMYYSHHLGGRTVLQMACLLPAPKATILNTHTYLSGWALIGDKILNPDHQLFGNFLTDLKRSRQLNHYPEMVQTAFETLLHFLSCSSSLLEFLTLRGQSIQIVPQTFYQIEDLRRMISWALCTPNNVFRSAVLERVLTLRPDFRCLAYASNSPFTREFRSFLQELYKRDKCSSPNIVRTEPADLLDQQFIDKCEGIAEPWDIDSDKEPLSPKYVLFGVKDQTVLVLLENVGPGQDEERGYGVTIYTSAMLDLM